MPIIPNVDLCRGYLFYGLGGHVVYANLNAARINKTGNNDRSCFDIKSLYLRGYYRADSMM